MRDGFCDWCVKCAKYLAFGTFERADDSALIKGTLNFSSFILIRKYICTSDRGRQLFVFTAFVVPTRRRMIEKPNPWRVWY